MSDKALGRCENKHVNVVAMDNLEAECQWPRNVRRKKGAPKDERPPCGKPMVEWALNGKRG